MSTASKTIQSATRAIREAIEAAMLDETQGPLLKASLKAALGLPLAMTDVAGTTLSLENAHNGAVIELLAADSAVTVRSQANYAWANVPAMMTIRSRYAFTIVTQAGVTVNNEVAKTWNCSPWPASVVLHRRASNAWGISGAAVVAP